MKKVTFCGIRLILISLLFVIIGCGKENQNPVFIKQISFSLLNNSEIERKDELILISLPELYEKIPDFNEEYFIIKENEIEISSQLLDLNGDNISDALAFVIDIRAGEKKYLSIHYNVDGVYKAEYPRRTQANLSVKTDYRFEDGYYKDGYFKSVDKIKLPEGHFPHNAFIKTEGPSWESEKIAYRFYLDERNRNDIFVKKVDSMITHIVGINDLVSDSKESYTRMTEWGMDNFKVGQTFGIGSIGMFYNNKVVTVNNTDSVICVVNNNGPVVAGVSTDYFGWKVNDYKYNLNSNLTIAAGSRLTKTSLTITGEPENICTGFAKHDNTNFIQSDNNYSSKWDYIALYGMQSLADDNMGIVVFYQNENLIKKTEDDKSYIVVLKPNEGILEYYFGAAWEKEKNGIKNREEFIEYLKLTQKKLNQPVEIIFNN